MPPRSASLTLRRPPSHWAVPVMMAVAAWVPMVALVYLPQIVVTGPAAPYVQNSVNWVFGRFTRFELAAISGFFSGLSLLMFFLGMTRVRLSEGGIQWEVFPYLWRRWRWTSLCEIRIDETGRHFEDDEFSKRTIIIRGPGPLGIGSDTLRLTNRVWDRFDEAELATVAVGVPAIATRMVQRLRKSPRPVKFNLDGSTSIVLVLLYFVLAGGAVYAALSDPLWEGALAPWRPLPMALAVALFLMGVVGFLAQSLAVDRRHLYVMRRGWVLRRVPLRNIADVETRDNATRIRVWRENQSGKSREIWRTDRFIRNRGVLLQLLRDLVSDESMEEEVSVPAKSRTISSAATMGPMIPTAIPTSAGPPPIPARTGNRVLSAAPPPASISTPSPIPETKITVQPLPRRPEPPGPPDPTEIPKGI